MSARKRPSRRLRWRGRWCFEFAARCLVEKMLTGKSEWSDAPFMVERAKRWVPEPIRSVGVAIARGAAERADRTEASGRLSRFWGPLFDALT